MRRQEKIRAKRKGKQRWMVGIAARYLEFEEEQHNDVSHLSRQRHNQV